MIHSFFMAVHVFPECPLFCLPDIKSSQITAKIPKPTIRDVGLPKCRFSEGLSYRIVGVLLHTKKHLILFLGPRWKKSLTFKILSSLRHKKSAISVWRVASSGRGRNAAWSNNNGSSTLSPRNLIWGEAMSLNFTISSFSLQKEACRNFGFIRDGFVKSFVRRCVEKK